MVFKYTHEDIVLFLSLKRRSTTWYFTSGARASGFRWTFMISYGFWVTYWEPLIQVCGDLKSRLFAGHCLEIFTDEGWICFAEWWFKKYCLEIVPTKFPQFWTHICVCSNFINIVHSSFVLLVSIIFIPGNASEPSTSQGAVIMC